ncbi:MAG: hypothetical protein QOK43_736 [Acidimicrobiaceae bacterium]|nr:hypothetical protein [Acidimicrobiaceae bacterium]
MTDVRDEPIVFEPFPEPRRRGRTAVKAALALAVAVLLVAGAVGVWAKGQISPGSPGAEVQVVVPRGASTARIAAILDAEGVISNARLFKLYAKYKGEGGFQAGSYQLHKHADFDDVLAVLGKGAKAESQRLTIPEGLTLVQIADRVGRLPGRSAAKFLDLARSGQFTSPYLPAGSTNLEGLLFPSTYELKPTEDEAAILQRMLNVFADVGAQVGLDQSQARVGLTPYQVVIVASMIEREARVAGERGMVARVVYNRLQKGIKLGIDATIRYGVDRPTQPLRKSDLAKDTPFNTRLHAGLPPTPIAAPGEATLQAALNPTPGPWLFYVLADQSGHHTFASTDAEFQRAVAVCRQQKLC